VSEIVLRFKDYRDILVRKTVISLIPILSQFDTAQFTSLHLDIFMNYLLAQLKKDRERFIAFVSIGNIAVQVKDCIIKYLDQIFFFIQDAFATR
jgi:FKBP12-rapamycin complex-associated protein